MPERRRTHRAWGLAFRAVMKGRGLWSFSIVVTLAAGVAGCGGDLSARQLRQTARGVPTPAGVQLVRELSYEDHDVLGNKFNVVTRAYSARGSCSQLADGWKQALRRRDVEYREERGAPESPMWRLEYRSGAADVGINLDYPRCTRPFIYVARPRG